MRLRREKRNSLRTRREVTPVPALIMEETGMRRKAAIRKLQRRARLAAKKAPKAARPKSEEPRTEAGSARAAGIALYKISGRPSKSDFLHVYGEMGPKWTWEARAKAVGLSTAEQAAEQFQEMLTKPKKSCLVPEETR